MGVPAVQAAVPNEAKAEAWVGVSNARGFDVHDAVAWACVLVTYILVLGTLAVI